MKPSGRTAGPIIPLADRHRRAAARLRTLVTLLGALVCALPGGGSARGGAPDRDRDYGSMYDDRLLEETAGEYREVVLWSLKNVYFPRLTPEERRRLQRLDPQFPLRGPERGLFEYFANPPAHVVLPVMAVRFL